jgi:uncharacterized membrane protein
MLWALLATVMFGAWGIAARSLANQMDWSLLAGVALIGYALALVILWVTTSPPELDELNWSTGTKAFTVGALAQCAVLLSYKALDSGGKATTVVAVTALYPAVALFGSIVFLDERVTVTQVIGVALAVIAVALIASGDDARTD